MNLFSVVSLLVSSFCFLQAIFIFYAANNSLQRIWGVFNVSVAFWAAGLLLVSISKSPAEAFIFWKVTYVAGLSVTTSFYHLAYRFCNLKRRGKICGVNILAISLALIVTSKYFIYEVKILFDGVFYNVATPAYTFFIVSVLSIVLMAFIEIAQFNKITSGIKKIQARYFIYGFGLGWVGGITTFLPSWGIMIYPNWHFSICLYILLMTYAIFKFQIMDVKILATRLGIFFLIYSLVLGIPFGLEAWSRKWLIERFGFIGGWIPMLTLLGFATMGPFLYFYFQRKAEERIFQEEIRAKNLLMQASHGMNNIYNLEHLVNLIIDVVVKILRLTSAEVFLFDKESNQYQKGTTALKVDAPPPLYLEAECEMIAYLKNKKSPIVYEEMSMYVNPEDNNKKYSQILSQMEGISASVVVPLIINDSMLGFLVLGDRKTREMFSKDLLNALAVLGNQAALAIENCYYLENESKRMQQEGLRERMQSLDNMASSMAHEIDNPMHGVRTSLAFIKNFIMKDPRFLIPEELSEDMQDAIKRIENCAQRVSAMIKAILDYSRLGTGQLMPIKIDEAVKGFLELINPQLKKEKAEFALDVEENLPAIFADRIQLEEILMNFVRNALHAVKLETPKVVDLKIFKKDQDTIRIECRDNGYGIKKEILKDIFLSSMTTKGSSEGTGLGLYRVRKIIDLFKGKVWAESEGKGQGATFIVELPICKGNMENFLKNDINNKQKENGGE